MLAFGDASELKRIMSFICSLQGQIMHVGGPVFNYQRFTVDDLCAYLHPLVWVRCNEHCFEESCTCVGLAWVAFGLDEEGRAFTKDLSYPYSTLNTGIQSNERMLGTASVF